MMHFYVLQIAASGQGVQIIKLFLTVTLTVMSLCILWNDSLLKNMQSVKQNVLLRTSPVGRG